LSQIPRAGRDDRVGVSILLPAFNAAATLPAALRSIRRQSFADWQCIAVDDGSTDTTLACLRSFAAEDPRFVVIATPHRGLVEALRAGLERCGGRFVARMDADDVMHRRRLEAQVAALEGAPSLSAVGCHVRLFPRADLRDGRRAYEAWLNRIESAADVRRDAYIECPVAHPTLMIRREVLARLGYRQRGWAEDYDLLLRLLAGGHEVGVVPRRLLSWRDHPERLSRTDSAYGLDRFTTCKAAFLAETFLRAGDEYVLWGFGDTGKAMRKALAFHGKRPALIVELHPGRLGKSIHGAPVIHPDQLPVHRGTPILVSVAGEEPRRQNRGWLAAMGFGELRDFVCVA
jgi:glycosyltransferase involved in cell wall biosynthesis